MTRLHIAYGTVLCALMFLLAVPDAVLAEDGLNSGDTAWLLTSTALVLFMTIPGLALFYAGLVRSKNVLSVLMQCFAITSLVTVLWVAGVYSLAFDGDGLWYGFVGGLNKAFMQGVGVDSLSGTIPETVFSMFQLTFAIITPALIIGAFAERMKFSATLWFSGLWLVLVYAPVAHWVWGGGWLGEMGVLDFAGGTVVHINAGFAGLVTALVLGKRTGYPHTPMLPHNMVLTVVGASMLWVGWFGFNAGSALTANGLTGMAMIVTHIACATAALVWMLIEWKKHGKPSVLGLVTGAVGGLVAVTPASGFIGPVGALCIGGAAGISCFWGATALKRLGGYDDSLDAFGVHGMGGLVGALLTGVFVSPAFQGLGTEMSILQQFGVQAIGALVTIVYCVIVTYLILKVVDAFVGLRVSETDEHQGLDIALHDERGYNF